MKGNLAGLMKQAQQMQENMKKAQEELASVEVEGQSGAGMVKVVMTCRHDVKRVTIDESLLKDDKDMLEDLIAAALNDAVRRVESTVQEKMGAVTAGLPLLVRRAAAGFSIFASATRGRVDEDAVQPRRAHSRAALSAGGGTEVGA